MQLYLMQGTSELSWFQNESAHAQLIFYAFYLWGEIANINNIHGYEKIIESEHDKTVINKNKNGINKCTIILTWKIIWTKKKKDRSREVK